MAGTTLVSAICAAPRTPQRTLTGTGVILPISSSPFASAGNSGRREKAWRAWWDCWSSLLLDWWIGGSVDYNRFASSFQQSTNPPIHRLTNLLFSASIGTIIEWYDFFVFASPPPLVFYPPFFPPLAPPTRSL